MLKDKKIICWFYLIMAVAGAVLPTLSNIEFVDTYGPGFDLSKFILMANINPAASSLSRDLLIGSSAVMVWVISESKRLKMKNLWIVIVSTFTIAFAFSVPLFLYLRERRLAEIDNEGFPIEYKS